MTVPSSRRSPSSGRHWEVAEIAPNATCRRCTSGGAQPPACLPSRTFGRLLPGAPLRFVLPPQVREVRGPDGRQCLRGAVSMSACASLVRPYTRSSGGVSPAKCSIRSSASSSAGSSSSSGLSSSASSTSSTSMNASVSLAPPNATRNGSMAVRCSCSEVLRCPCCHWLGRGAAPATRRRPIGGRRVLTTPAAAKTPICARNWVNFNLDLPALIATMLCAPGSGRPRRTGTAAALLRRDAPNDRSGPRLAGGSPAATGPVHEATPQPRPCVPGQALGLARRAGALACVGYPSHWGGQWVRPAANLPICGMVGDAFQASTGARKNLAANRRFDLPGHISARVY